MVGYVINLYIFRNIQVVYIIHAPFMLENEFSPTGQMGHINIKVDGRTNWPPIPWRILVIFFHFTELVIMAEKRIIVILDYDYNDLWFPA